MRMSRVSRRRILGATTALLTATGVAAVAAPAAGAATVWTATGTHALQLRNATAEGPAAATTPLRLTVGLRPSSQQALAHLITAQATPSSPQYHHYLTPAQYTAQFAATPAAAAAVADYLSQAGMQHVQVSANRLQVTADATVAQAEQAFNTQIGAFRQNGAQVLANTAPAQVPAALHDDVSAVLGLSTLGMSAPTIGVPKLTGYYPNEFVKVYDAGATDPGSNTSLAIIAEGDLTQTVSDLRTAESQQGLPQVPVTIDQVGPPSTDTSGTDEWDLDSQTSTGVAPDAARLYFYDASSLDDSDLSQAINAFVSQDVAQAGSASLGECDILPYLDGSMAVDDAALAEAAAQGQTFFASTGDTGSSCAVLPTNGVPLSGLPDTEYPASSTYATAVGGTTLDTDDSDNYQTEIAWNAGGGGISPVETGGSWQSGVVPTSIAGLRGTPDVAFDADPDTGALVYVDGTAEEIGGTSLSSPMALGFWTRLESSHGNSLGFAPPALYGLDAAGTTSGFHDVVLGVNGTYAATPGWDYTTGLGSWDVDALSGDLG
jgi:pseudomonalisin